MNINLGELTLEKVSQWPKAVKYFLVSTLSILSISLSYWLLIKPINEQYKNLTTEETTLKSNFEIKQQQAVNLEPYKKQLQVINKRFANMLKQLPAQNEMPGLLEDITRTGIASGLTFELFAPQADLVHDFYVELPINILVVGNYHQLAIFISRVAQMSRLVTLHDFDIVVHKDKQNLGSGDLLEMALTAKIYRYKIQ